MTREDVDDMICDILLTDGPDGHVDGHEVLTDFVMALLEGRGEQWREAYQKRDPEAS